jgi:hypothetical protein
MVGELDRLAARSTAAFAPRRTLGPTRRKQLKLFQAPEQFWIEK